MMRLLVLFFIGGALLASSAAAHQFSCDGKPVPADVKASCCGVADAHQVQTGDLREDDKGVWHVIIGGVEYPITYKGSGRRIEALPSPDGCNWVWYRVYGSIVFYCLMIPLDL